VITLIVSLRASANLPIDDATNSALSAFAAAATDRHYEPPRRRGGNSLQRRSWASVLDLVSLLGPSSNANAVAWPRRADAAAPIASEGIDPWLQGELAARTHVDSPPHLPALVLGAPGENEAALANAWRHPLLAYRPPLVWLPNDGLSEEEADDGKKWGLDSIWAECVTLDRLALPARPPVPVASADVEMEERL